MVGTVVRRHRFARRRITVPDNRNVLSRYKRLTARDFDRGRSTGWFRQPAPDRARLGPILPLRGCYFFYFLGEMTRSSDLVKLDNFEPCGKQLSNFFHKQIPAMHLQSANLLVIPFGLTIISPNGQGGNLVFSGVFLGREDLCKFFI